MLVVFDTRKGFLCVCEEKNEPLACDCVDVGGGIADLKQSFTPSSLGFLREMSSLQSGTCGFRKINFAY